MRLALALCVLAGMVGATPPEASLRPVSRAAPVVPDAVLELALPGPPDVAAEPVSLQAAALSLRPELRPPQVVERAMAQRRERRRGAVCGDIDIQGEEAGYVAGRVSGCGVEQAVRIRAVSGVSLSPRAIMDCRTAKTLNSWVTRTAKPTLRGIGGGLVRLQVAAHYACRSRNNEPGARISEHGKGRAIDISGFVLKNGSVISVEHGWTAGETTQVMRKLHRGACGPFGTVLGPDADIHHRDHFHFDTARYRSGSYCR